MALSSPRNKKLSNVLSKFDAKYKSLSTYEQYQEKSRPAYIEADRLKLQDDFGKEITLIINEAKKDLEYHSKDIFNTQTGDLKKMSYSNQSARNVASQEYNNALTLAHQKPSNLRNILQTAISQGRTEFVYSVIDILSTDKKLDERIKHQLESATKLADNAFGVSEKRKNQTTAQTYINEGNNYLELLSNDVNGFAKRAGAFVSAQENYDDHKQYRAIPERVEVNG